MTDTGTEPETTPRVRRGVVLPRVDAVPRSDQIAPDASGTVRPRHAAGVREGRRPVRRLALMGVAGAAALAAVAAAVIFTEAGSTPRPAAVQGPGTTALDQVPPTPKWAASVRPPKKSAKPSRAPRTGTPTPHSHQPVTHHWRTLVVHPTYVLNPGDTVRTNRISLGLRSDGDLVLKDEHGRVTWSSGTRAVGARAVFQSDGNFVLYQGDQTVWSTRTDGHNGATLVLRADGDVAIVYGTAVLWRTGTG